MGENPPTSPPPRLWMCCSFQPLSQTLCKRCTSALDEIFKEHMSQHRVQRGGREPYTPVTPTISSGGRLIQVHPRWGWGGMGGGSGTPWICLESPPKHSPRWRRFQAVGQTGLLGCTRSGRKGDVDCGFAWVCVPAQVPCS